MIRLFTILLLTLAVISCKKNKPNEDTTPNPWDARYRVEGTLVDNVQSVITYPGPQEFHLVPKPGNKIEIICKELGISGHLILHGGSLSYYSKFGLLLSINPSNNKITAIENTYGQPSENGRSAELDPSGINAYDPATKTIKIKYWMNETGVTGHRTAFNETWTYLGPR